MKLPFLFSSYFILLIGDEQRRILGNREDYHVEILNFQQNNLREDNFVRSGLYLEENGLYRFTTHFYLHLIRRRLNRRAEDSIQDCEESNNGDDDEESNNEDMDSNNEDMDSNN